MVTLRFQEKLSLAGRLPGSLPLAGEVMRARAERDENKGRWRRGRMREERWSRLSRSSLVRRCVGWWIVCPLHDGFI